MTFSSRDLEKVRTQGKNSCGRRHPVGDDCLNVRQISELTGKAQSTVSIALRKGETAEHYINRVGLVGLPKSDEPF